MFLDQGVREITSDFLRSFQGVGGREGSRKGILYPYFHSPQEESRQALPFVYSNMVLCADSC